MGNRSEATDTWPLYRIVKYVLLPKPAGSPRAGWKEWTVRVSIASAAAGIGFVLWCLG
jgi:hypothetical protein